MNEYLKIAKFIMAEDWKEKEVEHKTPSGQVRKVKVKSLPPAEQEKYRPKDEKKEEETTKTKDKKQEDTKDTGKVNVKDEIDKSKSKGFLTKIKDALRTRKEKNKIKSDFVQSLKPDADYKFKEYSTDSITVGMHGSNKIEINDESRDTGWVTVDLEKPLTDLDDDVMFALDDVGLYKKIEKMQADLKKVSKENSMRKIAEFIT